MKGSSRIIINGSLWLRGEELASVWKCKRMSEREESGYVWLLFFFQFMFVVLLANAKEKMLKNNNKSCKIYTSFPGPRDFMMIWGKLIYDF